VLNTAQTESGARPARTVLYQHPAQIRRQVV
jgi:hypothetical protein